MSVDLFTRFCQCSNRFSDDCPVGIHTRGDQVVKLMHEHTHECDAAGIEVVKIRNVIKRRALETQEVFFLIYVQRHVYKSFHILPNRHLPSSLSMLFKLFLEVRNMLSIAQCLTRFQIRTLSAEQLKSNVTSQKKRLQILLLQIHPAEYRIFDGRNFILSDSGPGQPGNERIIIFGNESNINYSNQITHLYIDGTFRISLPMFRQLIGVLACRDDYVVPIFYGLLPNKTRRNYDCFLSMIKQVTEVFHFLPTDFLLVLILIITSR